MPLEQTDIIDMAKRLPTGEFSLVITDSGVTSDPDRRLDLLQKKLQTYAAYAAGGEFVNDYPDGGGKDSGHLSQRADSRNAGDSRSRGKQASTSSNPGRIPTL